MKLSLNIYKAVFFLSLVIIIMLFYFFLIDQPDIESTRDTRLIPVKEALIALHQGLDFKNLSKEEKLEKTYQILEQLPPEYKGLKRQYQIALSTLPNITFYGRIIDQYGQPVRGAKVRYSGTNTYLSAGAGRGQVVTNTDGFFEIDTEGAALNLGAIFHPDIEYAYQKDSGVGGEISQAMLKSTKYFLSQQDKNGIYATWRNHTEKDKAYIIHAWRLGEYGGAIEGGVSFGLHTGKMYTINLTHADKHKRISEGLHDGDLRITCTRPHIESYYDTGNWSVSIVPVNGGIVETDDLYMNLAPVSGYQAKLEINMHKDNPNYQKALLNKRYYITLNNGQKYGSLFVNIMPFVSIEDDACSIQITSKINPTGSRNLELKHDKTSMPQIPSPQKLGRIRGQSPLQNKPLRGNISS